MREVFRVRLTTKAQRAAWAAIAYYIDINPELGSRFSELLEDRLSYLTSRYYQHQLQFKDVRMVRVPDFPYLIYYRVKESRKEVKVLTILHERQNRR